MKKREMKIKEMFFPLCLILLLASVADCQDRQVLPVSGGSRLIVDAHGNRLDQRSRYGASIWNNSAESSWFSSMTASYIWLDWGKLDDQGNGLPDEVIDGFTFNYVSVHHPALSWEVYFFDGCTGWGDLTSVQEAGFVFTGLPTGNPWWPAWGWAVTVDLTDSGQEFLMGDRIGVGQALATQNVACGPRIGRPPNVSGNGPTDTEDAFDIYSHLGTFMGTNWFGGYPAAPYASFSFELFGASDPALGTTYAGIGMQGNEAALYTLGEWDDGESVHFLLRKNGKTNDGWIVANTTYYWPPWYLHRLDITLGPRAPFLTVVPMTPDLVGDFSHYALNVGAAGANLRVYMQGAITDYFNGGAIAPIDLSNVVVSN